MEISQAWQLVLHGPASLLGKEKERLSEGSSSSSVLISTARHLLNTSGLCLQLSAVLQGWAQGSKLE